jgi:perosamine synthetase
MSELTAIQIPVSEPYLTSEAKSYVMDCLDSGWISSKGSYVTELEVLFAQRTGVTHAISVSNGTAALHLAVLAADIGPGDEVIIPDLTFAATANAVLHCGAVPVLVDVNRQDWTIDVSLIEAAITEKTKAIIPVHLYGNLADMAAINELAVRHQLLVIEDCAESLGATYKGSPTGSLGDMGCFSFFANKLITTGEGGMVTTNSAELARKVRSLRDHGMSVDRRYWHEIAGLNYRMTNLQAAVGVSQMAYFDQFVEKRRHIEQLYQHYLSKLPGIIFMQVPAQCQSVNWLTSLRVDPGLTGGIAASDIARQLRLQGVETRAFFFPLHQQPPYQANAAQFPVSLLLSSQGLSLPTYYRLTDEQIKFVCCCIYNLFSVPFPSE